ncbi:DNA-binding MarR family transcriptional regulator [Bacillus niacini]|uniref:DNA-binding MarR family transcriptional regulator n=1 Tax=Neobacillus niacini TaxID=86668 RepID=A0A852TN81_9BACI|nr:MarR family transcriptional regulator [Neobacillus niacini]NYE09591.1 DNA-binding MarR family transcriptional regulator [Neobacillus niacini]
MSEDSKKMIELELTVLIRLLTSITSSKRKESLDRAAYLLLHQVSVQGSSGVKALADELKLDISTVSRQAASLEHKGYVEKVPDPQDGRAFFYKMTELGEQELVQHRQERLNGITNLLNGWSDEECREFGQLLTKFNHAIKERK